jgi:fructan beta-fructosidase
MTFTLLLAAALAAPAGRPDLLVAGFDGDDYAGWVATGTAFGTRPARGTLPGQMEVSGYLGLGLVNSFLGGDDATGTLTSPPFAIERPFLSFLIGGGKFPGETCLNLLVDGRVVRTATGPNAAPGGSERLEWQSWDVRDLVGKSAVLQVIDRRTGGWGHVNVDQIVQGDLSKAPEPASHTIAVRRRYLHLPVKRQAAARKVRVTADGRPPYEFDISLPDDGGGADFWVSLDLVGLAGSSVRFEAVLPAGSRALEALRQDDAVPGAADLYRERDRPQIHFTARRGWLNDPNGLVWQGGTYHLFFQHNPYGWDWGNMHWGHAVSPDLVHWAELPVALYPHEPGDGVFSGSAVVDAVNTSGWGAPSRPALVAAFTSTRRGECLAYSTDGGRTFTEYAKNPVLSHAGRDPRLLWHGPTRRWVMAVYDARDGKDGIAFHSSADLKAWRPEGRIDEFYECPDLFELPVAGRPAESRWVLYAGDGQYLLGRFDGHGFNREGPSQEKHRVWYGDFYAAQTFSDAPGGRRVQVGWGRGIAFPGMPFNQQMTVPVELTLRPTPEGLRLFAEPVRELAGLRARTHPAPERTIEPGHDVHMDFASDLLEVEAEAVFGADTVLTLAVRGVAVVADGRALRCGDLTVPLEPVGGRVALRVLLDRGSVEVFGNRGRVAISMGVRPGPSARGLPLSSRGSAARLTRLVVHELCWAWSSAS